MRLTKKRILSILGVLFLGLIGWTGWSLIPGKFVERMPDPNGYDDLVAAGSQSHGELAIPNNLDYVAVSPVSLHEFVDPNIGALERARIGLGRGCRVRLPLRWMEMAHFDNLLGLLRLAQLLAADSALAEQGGNRAKAVADAFDILRLGRATGDGGVLIDAGAGMGIESIGLSVLSRRSSQAHRRRRQAPRRRVDQVRPIRRTVQSSCRSRSSLHDGSRRFSNPGDRRDRSRNVKGDAEIRDRRPGAGLQARYSFPAPARRPARPSRLCGRSSRHPRSSQPRSSCSGQSGRGSR